MTTGRIALAATVLVAATGVAAALPQPPGGPGPFDQRLAPAAFADGVAARLGGPLPGGPHGRHGLDPRRVADYLQLTEEQRASARQLFEGQRERVRPLLEQQRALREQLETALDDPAAGDAALGQLVKQLHANRQALEAVRDEAKASFAAILDEGQKAKLQQLESVIDRLGLSKRRGPGRRG